MSDCPPAGMDGQTDGLMDGRAGEWVDERTDGWSGGWMDGRTKEWVDRWTLARWPFDDRVPFCWCQD